MCFTCSQKPFAVLSALVRDSLLFADTVDEPEMMKADEMIVAHLQFVSVQSVEKLERLVLTEAIAAMYFDS